MTHLLLDSIAPPRLRYGSAALLLSSVLAAYVASGGVRRYLPPIVGLPAAVAVGVVALGGDPSLADWAVIANPLVAALVVSILAVTTEESDTREFVASRAASRRRRELTREIEHVTELNGRLSTTLSTLQSEMSERRRLEEELKELATRDDLTGALNRRAGLARLAKYIEIADVRGTHLCVVFLDIDRLKSTNDQLGHPAGDEVLRRVARGLRQQIRASDFITRIGGDEFVVAFEDCTQRQAIAVVERTRLLLHSEPAAGQLDFSYGCFEYVPGSGLSADELLRIADSRMYEFKRLKSENTE
jgi:diguanylate cyclase (GGDEF)-like protein